MASHRLLLLSLAFLAITASTTAHNITDILSGHPEYSQFCDYLTRTKLDSEINSRETVTVLVIPNSAMSSLTSHPLAAIKNELSLHVLLDYFDPKKLHQLSDGTTLSTTLYQTTGNAPGSLGSVNITDLKGGAVGFGSGIPGSKLDCTYTKAIKQIPYNISVLEVSSPINAPAVLAAAAPSASTGNITGLLEKAGCKTFASLIESSGVLKVYQSQFDKGLTLFAPNDEAFKAKGVPDLSKLTNAELVSLLQYHALNTYNPKGSLKTSKDSLTTLATNGAGKYGLSVKTAGDDVSLDTGVDTSRVASTVLDDPPVVIFTVDSVLLPQELFGKSPTPAPAPAPVSDSPSPSTADAPAPISDSPMASPPAPTGASPEESPADAPSKSSRAAADKANDAISMTAVKGLSLLASAVAAAVVLC
ncbi:hypothetical protein V2J09_015205 [Rumex salicifolius]